MSAKGVVSVAAAAMVLLAVAAAPAASRAVDPALPRYEPRPARPPKGARYVQPDGAVAIVGYNDMAGMLKNLNAVFVQSHPGYTFAMRLQGTAAAVPALTHGVSAFAPMGFEFFEYSAAWLEPYKKITGLAPIAFRVAHDSLDRKALSSPVAVFVNKANPLEKLTVAEVARIFTTGAPGGDVTHWGQLGLKGEWAGRAVHNCAGPDESVGRLMSHKMGGRTSAARDGLSADRARQVAEDVAAIGWGQINRIASDVKVLPIASTDGADYERGTPEEIAAGTYAFDRYLYIYVRRVPGEPFDPFVREYLRLVLSREGQEAIAADELGYIPLSAREAAEERAKLDVAASGSERPHAQSVSLDGALSIVGDDGMEAPLARLNQAFLTTHPGVRFRMLLKGSSTGVAALSAGVAALAPMAREATAYEEVRPFRQLHGYEPTDIHIGRAGYSAPGRNNPPGVYVHARNPIAGLTVAQVARIFTTGGGTGDLTQWSQLGLGGEWGGRAIHVFGTRDDGRFATAMRNARMGGFPFTRRYEPLAACADVIRAVAEDPYGIGLVGVFDSSRLPREVKFVPLAAGDGAPYSSGTYADALEGRYPYTPYIRLYVNRAPGAPLDPIVRDYARLALSREGQAIIAAQKDSAQGYLPLPPKEVAEELAKLE
jgi:phosphate transport system substrate-binding protein